MKIGELLIIRSLVRAEKFPSREHMWVILQKTRRHTTTHWLFVTTHIITTILQL